MRLYVNGDLKGNAEDIFPVDVRSWFNWK